MFGFSETMASHNLLHFFRIAVVLSSAVPMDAAGSDPARETEIAQLRRQIAEQQTQIESLRALLEQQARVVERLAATEPKQAAVSTSEQKLIDTRQPATPAEAPKAISGFQFSGDFRLRADLQARSGNDVAGPLQNARARYRVRLNVDKAVDPRTSFHLQLSTGPFNNALTNDQDMAGGVAKSPFSISEAWIDFRPNRYVALRGGRMEEVFADNTRFLWDDDVRFNGFQQTLRIPLGPNPLGVTSVELRAGEYILTNPAVYVLAPNSPFVAAGYEPGRKVRDANLFHPGATMRGRLSSAWDHQFTGDFQFYRNPNQIQLASTAAGYGALINPAIGLNLSGAMGATGNATTAPGGAVYFAPNYRIAHFGYRLERRGVLLGGREFPAWVDFQGSRNLGAWPARDAFMISGNFGSVKQAGDMRFLYQFAVKDANSLISQFTDDDLGTGSGVNIAVHAFRMDLGLSRHVQLQNLLFVQHQRRSSDPAQGFFVPLGRGANPTLRYLGQLAFSF